MNKKWTIILIIFLLAANAALLTTLIVSNSPDDKETLKTNMHHNREYEGSGRFEKHIAHELEMTEEQKELLKGFSKEFKLEKHTHFEDMAQLKKQYFKQLSTEEPNTQELELLADSLGHIQAKIMLLDHKHYRNIRSICNEDQARKLDSLGQRRIHNNNNRNRRSRTGRRQ